MKNIIHYFNKENNNFLQSKFNPYHQLIKYFLLGRDRSIQKLIELNKKENEYLKFNYGYEYTNPEPSQQTLSRYHIDNKWDEQIKKALYEKIDLQDAENLEFYQTELEVQQEQQLGTENGVNNALAWWITNSTDFDKKSKEEMDTWFKVSKIIAEMRRGHHPSIDSINLLDTIVKRYKDTGAVQQSSIQDLIEINSQEDVFE